MPHLLGHGASVYNSHLRGPVTSVWCIAMSCLFVVSVLFFFIHLEEVGAKNRKIAGTTDSKRV